MNNNILDLSVVIPFKDKAKMTIDCIKSFYAFGPPVKEILLISNGSSNTELGIIREYIKSKKNVLLFEYNIPFNYQKINNWAVKKTSGKFIMFLNNDTELRGASTNLINNMYKKAGQKDVGITGCLLLYGDEKTIQHAGVYLVPSGQADHMYVGKRYSDALAKKNTKEYPYDITKDIPMTSVTGAVNIIEREKFNSINGFDERFIICGGDVDLCIRLNKKGYQTWFVSGGYILHKESQSRAHKPVPYNDFYYSYLSYVQGFDIEVGDPFLPKLTIKERSNNE